MHHKVALLTLFVGLLVPAVSLNAQIQLPTNENICNGPCPIVGEEENDNTGQDDQLENDPLETSDENEEGNSFILQPDEDGNLMLPAAVNESSTDSDNFEMSGGVAILQFLAFIFAAVSVLITIVGTVVGIILFTQKKVRWGVISIVVGPVLLVLSVIAFILISVYTASQTSYPWS
jgi:hypothetical protein